MQYNTTCITIYFEMTPDWQQRFYLQGIMIFSNLSIVSNPIDHRVRNWLNSRAVMNYSRSHTHFTLGFVAILRHFSWSRLFSFHPSSASSVRLFSLLFSCFCGFYSRRFALRKFSLCSLCLNYVFIHNEIEAGIFQQRLLSRELSIRFALSRIAKSYTRVYISTECY